MKNLLLLFLTLFSKSVTGQSGIDFHPDTLNFGIVMEDSLYTKTMNCINTGNSPLQIQLVIPAGGYMVSTYLVGGTPPGDSTPISIQLNPPNLGSHVRHVRVFSNAPTSPDTFYVKFNAVPPTATNEIETDYLRLYPNPVKDFLHIELFGDFGQEVEYQISNATGSTFLKKRSSGRSENLDLKEIKSGFYFLTIQHQNKFISKHFIKT